MSYSTLRKSRAYIVVPRDVPPENFLFVPETRKERKAGPSKCIICPLIVFLLAGGLLACCGYFLHQESGVQWPRIESGFFNQSDSADDEEATPSCFLDTEGSTCKSCKSGYWHLTPHKCSPCLCSLSGSSEPACHPVTGQCQCRDRHGGHKCDICPSGQVEQGGRCEEREEEFLDPCAASPCSVGGTCEAHDGTFTCYCAQGRTGKLCEKTTEEIGTAGFTPHSVLVVRNTETHTEPSSSLVLRLRPEGREGVLLSSSTEGVNISLSLVGGYIQYQYQSQHHHLAILSPSPLAMGSWTSLAVRTYHQDLSMQVGTMEPVTATLGEAMISGWGHTVTIGGSYTGCMAGIRMGGKEPIVLTRRGVTACPTKETVLLDTMMRDQARHTGGRTLHFTGETVRRILNRRKRRVFSEEMNEFVFEIRTFDKNAVLLSTGDKKDIFEIAIDDGRVGVKVVMGSDSGVGVSQRRINTGVWSKVWVGRKGRKVIVKIVGEESFSFTIGEAGKVKGRRRLRSDGYIWLGKQA